MMSSSAPEAASINQPRLLEIQLTTHCAASPNGILLSVMNCSSASSHSNVPSPRVPHRKVPDPCQLTPRNRAVRIAPNRPGTQLKRRLDYIPSAFLTAGSPG